MVDEPVALDEILRTREDLIDEIVGKMPEEHRRFLIFGQTWQAKLGPARPSRCTEFAGRALET